MFFVKKTEFSVDGKIFSADSIGYEYSQQDGDESGRSDDGTMYRDVKGLANKVYYDFIDFRNEDAISDILKLLDKTSCTLQYYDLKEKGFVSKNMYVVGDKVQAKIIGDDMTCEPFQIRFIQINIDEVS